MPRIINFDGKGIVALFELLIMQMCDDANAQQSA